MKIRMRRWFRVYLSWALVGFGSIGALVIWLDTSMLTSARTFPFWSWPGWLSLALLTIGLASLAMRRRHLSLLASVIVVILLAFLVTSLAWVFIGFALYGEWTTALPTSETTRADATRLVLTITAGIGAAVALVVAYRRQGDLEEGRFLERLATAARQIGDREPIVQFSGIYALVALADEPTATGARQFARSQQCVNVLCAYLRLPYAPATQESFVDEIVHKQTWVNARGQTEETRTYRTRPSDKEVRSTILRIIGEHLQPYASSSWSNLSFDFRGAEFDGGDFGRAVFNGALTDFSGGHFSGGTVDFSHARFAGGVVDFSGARFSGGTVSFSHARFAGGVVDFSGAHFSHGTVKFDNAQFSRGEVRFDWAKFAGSDVTFMGASFSGSAVSFLFSEFTGGSVSFWVSRFTRGTIDLGSTWFSGGTVDFHDARFSGSTVTFQLSHFQGADVVFAKATLSRGTVDFTNARFAGGRVDFDGFDGTAPGELIFRDPKSWDVPPIVPWGLTAPRWVRPTSWPPVIPSEAQE